MILFFFSPFTALACENQFVRDVAFWEDRDIHRLSVIFRKGDAAGPAIRERLERWLSTLQPDFNLELHTLIADDPSVRWSDYGLPSAPPTTPVVVLSGYRSFECSAFYIDHWEPEPSYAELDELKTSPAREAITRAAAGNLAVLLHIPAIGAIDPRVQKVKDSVIRSYAGEILRVTDIQVDRNDMRERILLSFLGIKPDGVEWLALVFGRGKVMPPLQGEEITEANLQSQLAELKGDCSCLRSTLSMGVDLPMVWNADRQQSVVTLASLTPASNWPVGERSFFSSRWASVSTASWTLLSLFAVAVLTAFAIVWKRRYSE